MKKLAIAVMFMIMCGISACTYNYKKGTMLPIPTYNEMTEVERTFSRNLFDGDTMVRVRLQNNDTIIAAVSVKRWKENKPNVEVSNDYNGGMYMVKE